MSLQYHVFGGCLHSDLEFPNLPRASDSSACSWRLRVRDDVAPECMERPLVSEQLSEKLTVTIASIAAGLRVSYSDTGVYELTDAGRTITWYRSQQCDVSNARLDVLGTLLVLSMHLNDRLTLHGSAISFESGVVAFLAPSGFGKSTLAMSLTAAGYKFMSDDAVPVRVVGDRVLAAPGVPSPRFLADSFARFGHLLPASVTDGDGKMTAGARLPDERIESGEQPVSALYVLNPVSPDGAAGPRRSELPPMIATIELLRNVKLARLLWGDESRRLLSLVTDVSTRVPVWTLDVPRDLDLLPSVVEQLIEWHASPSAVPA